MKYGVDVAKWNGTIDWEKVKKDGIAFAILKVTQKNNSVEDAFEKNYESATAAGLRIGVYRYVYAKNEVAAVAEADAIVKVLDGKTINYRVWIDIEDDSIRYLGKDKLSAIIKAETDVLKTAGYEVGVYCNYDWYKNVLDTEWLKQNYPLWIARYGTNNGEMQDAYSTEAFAHAWQYTSQGNVDGINGNVDLDVVFSEMDIEPDVPETYIYSVGQTVKYSSYYKKETDDITKAKLTGANYPSGKITAIVPGARNPYQVNNKACYLNDGDIRSVITVTESEAVYHTVKAGQNLTVISKIYGTTVNELLKKNAAITNKNVIYTGQKIRIR